MKVITGTADFRISSKTAVTIGKFDGVHLGHRKLIEEILAQKANGLTPLVFTFDPAPAVLFGIGDGKELSSREEKRHILESLGVEILIEYPMTFETASMQPEEFVREVLCRKMNTGFVAAGTDLSFGDKGRGNAALLTEMSKECGFDVRIIDKVLKDGREISSTYVREEVENGRMKEAAELLGCAYSVTGTVVHGNHLGTGMGMPTCNLIIEEHKLMPPNGVYYSGVWMEGKYYKGISNVGYKPTIREEEKHLGLETYLYDFAEDAYGSEIQVLLYEFKRPEMKFDGLEQLKAQIAADIAEGGSY